MNRPAEWRAAAYPVMVTVGWAGIVAALLLLVGGLLIGEGGPLPPSRTAAQAAALLARIAPWPVLLPLAVVLLLVARRAVRGAGWPRAIAIGTSAVFLAFGLLGARWSDLGLVLVGKLAWLAANGFVVIALLSAPGEDVSTA